VSRGRAVHRRAVLAAEIGDIHLFMLDEDARVTARQLRHGIGRTGVERRFETSYREEGLVDADFGQIIRYRLQYHVERFAHARRLLGCRVAQSHVHVTKRVRPLPRARQGTPGGAKRMDSLSSCRSVRRAPCQARTAAVESVCRTWS
jgi:hypothetical protein